MLHTLNKAWANILIKQAENNPNKSFLFVCDKDGKEAEMACELIENSNANNVYLVTETMISGFRELEESPDSTFELLMFDDILISHDIHDIMIKDFLSRHCKRKGS